MTFADFSLTRRIESCRKFSSPYRVTDGAKFRLKDIDPGDTGGLGSEDKAESKELLTLGIETLAHLQDRLYAGKDGTIKHVMSGVNPQGCQVFSFKQPSAEELNHDYLWRCLKRLPERGRIGIFNRSYYEEVLVVKVHDEMLESQKLPPSLVGKSIWKNRYQDICNVEKYLTRNGIVICKFFLHLSKKEQKKRFLERLDRPEKNWKFSMGDAKERKYWRKYQGAYEDMIRATATKYAPWYVMPADNKWFTRLAVAAAIIETLGTLGLDYPQVDDAQKAELAAARAALEGE